MSPSFLITLLLPLLDQFFEERDIILNHFADSDLKTIMKNDCGNNCTKRVLFSDRYQENVFCICFKLRCYEPMKVISV